MSLTAVYNHPQNGYSPAKHLEVGKEYIVERVNMGQTTTDIHLAGYTGIFNSVQFDFFEDGKPVDIYRNPKYNPYLQMRMKKMKCPWRPVQVTEQFDEKRREIVKIDFEECYEGECPFYSPERKISENLFIPEHCKRIKQEVQR